MFLAQKLHSQVKQRLRHDRSIGGPPRPLRQPAPAAGLMVMECIVARRLRLFSNAILKHS